MSKIIAIKGQSRLVSGEKLDYFYQGEGVMHRCWTKGRNLLDGRACWKHSILSIFNKLLMIELIVLVDGFLRVKF